MLLYACEHDNFTFLTLKIDVLSSFFSQDRFICASLRCLTEAILTSDLCFEENVETKVIYLT